jgi:hypothetical protein
VRFAQPSGVALAVAMVLFAACNGDTGQVNTRSAPSTPARSASPSPSEPPRAHRVCDKIDFDLGDIDRFSPPIQQEGDTTVVSLTFLDGSSVELLMPATLDISSRGLSVYSVGQIKRFARDFWIFPAPLDQVLLAFHCPRAINVYKDGAGEVIGLWRFPADPEIDYLAFPFGEWTVLVYDYRVLRDARMTNRVRKLWATSLTGRETDDGFLVLTARPPLRLAAPASRYKPTLTLFGKDGKVELIGNYCPPQRQRRVSYWCLDGHVTVKPLGSKKFAQTLRRVLDLRAFNAPAS